MTAKRRTTSKRTSTPPKPVTAHGADQVFVLDVPYEARQAASWAGAVYDRARRKWVYVGPNLPPVLKMFTPAPLTWAAWQAAEATGDAWTHYPGDGTITLRTHQERAAGLIMMRHAKGLPGTLIADEVGLGKTFSTIAAVNKLSGVRNVLVVSPLSVVAAWRKSLMAYGTADKNWCLINVDGLKKLLSVPKSAAAAKKTKTKNTRIAKEGRPLVSWDVVVLDESHLFRNVTSQRSHAMRTITADAHVVYLSATAGQNPLELAYLAPLLGEATGREVRNLEAFEQWCTAEGIAVTRGSYGKWEWDKNDRDLATMRRILFAPGVESGLPLGIRRRPTDIAGWPSQHRITHPIALEGDAARLYDEAWTKFRREKKLVARGKDPSGGLAAKTRFRQKASLLRAEGVAELVKTLVDNGKQVGVSVQWIETLDAIEELLTKAKIATARIEGSLTAAQREAERQRFQTGDATVVLFTVVEGINLHASEAGANGVDRVTVIADPRYSGIQSVQIEGRLQRDGCRSDAYYVYAEGTVEEDVVTRAVRRMGDMGEMTGDDVTALRALQAELEGIEDAAAAADDEGDEDVA